MKIRSLARAVGLDAPPRLQPPECSVALPDPIFDIVSAAEPDRAFEGGGDVRAIFLMNDLQIGCRGQPLRRRVRYDREHAGCEFVGNQAVAGDIPGPGPDRAGCERRLQPRLCNPQRLFDPLQLVDVGAGAKPLHQATLRIVYRLGGGGEGWDTSPRT